MKKILCYGDSNTFGYIPKTQKRYDINSRWSGILKTHFANTFEIIEDGVCDRNAFVSHKNGTLLSSQKYFPALMTKFDTIEYSILAVGTNDLQTQYDIDLETIEKGLEFLVKTASEKSKNIIVLSPVALTEKVKQGYFSYQFDDSSIAKVEKVLNIYKNHASILKYQYLDVNKITAPSDYDGLHYDRDAHQKIANALINIIEKSNQ